ncbi:MAG: hypothetical protein H6619_00835 [Deltaproteobacteria bacterium]|nr:hypothetical protein [Deltaproteobacteria bacterium]
MSAERESFLEFTEILPRKFIELFNLHGKLREFFLREYYERPKNRFFSLFSNSYQGEPRELQSYLIPFMLSSSSESFAKFSAEFFDKETLLVQAGLEQEVLHIFKHKADPYCLNCKEKFPFQNLDRAVDHVLKSKTSGYLLCLLQSLDSNLDKSTYKDIAEQFGATRLVVDGRLQQLDSIENQELAAPMFVVRILTLASATKQTLQDFISFVQGLNDNLTNFRLDLAYAQDKDAKISDPISISSFCDGCQRSLCSFEEWLSDESKRESLTWILDGLLLEDVLRNSAADLLKKFAELGLEDGAFEDLSMISRLPLKGIALGRSVSSLSSGESLSLKLIKLFKIALSDSLVILDNLLSDLSSAEKELFCSILKDFALNSECSVVAISAASQEKFNPKKVTRSKVSDREAVIKTGDLFCWESLELSFPYNKIVCLRGPTGSGKTLFLNQIVPQFCESNSIKFQQIKKEALKQNDSIYFNLKVNTELEKAFAASKVSRMKGYSSKDFSLKNSGYLCKVCNGKGLVALELTAESCLGCAGKFWSEEIANLELDNLSLHQYLNLNIDQWASVSWVSQKKHDVLLVLSELGLGQKKLTETFSNYSSNERLKTLLAKVLASRVSKQQDFFIMLDQQFSDLSNREVAEVGIVLKRCVDQGATILIADNSHRILELADFVIELDLEYDALRSSALTKVSETGYLSL